MQIEINGQEINCEVLPLVSETLDESLDIFSFALKISKLATPFAPMQQVKVTTDNNEELLFVISSDSVSLASLEPVVYKHEIHCTQNTQELKKHLVRNTVFSQPPSPWEIFNQPHSFCVGFATENTSLPDYINRYHASLVRSGFSVTTSDHLEKVTLGARKKLSRCLFKIDFRIVQKNQTGSVGSGSNTWYYPKDSDEVLTHFASMEYSTISFASYMRIHYYDAQGNAHSVDKTPLELFGVNKWLFNQEVEVELFNDLINQGCYDIYIGDVMDSLQIMTGDIYAAHESLSPIFYTVNYRFKVETYYHTCYDILNLLIKRQQQEYNDEAKDPLFKLKQSGELYDLLTHTIAPNYTFTQNTLYECVAEVFRLFDAIFTMDEDGYLDIEYFNDNNGEELPINTKIAGANLSLGENKFVNRLVAYYQNAKEEITHPNKKGFCKPRSETLGIPKDISDFSYLVEYDINQITEVNLLVTSVRVNVGWGASQSIGFTTRINVTGNFLIDMTRYCVPQDLWALLNQAKNDSDIKVNPQKRYQFNTISYSGKKIDLCNTMKMSNGITFFSLNIAILCAYWYQLGLTGAGQFGTINDISIYYINEPSVEYSTTNQPDFEDINMQVKYIANLDGRTISESNSYKYEGEELIDQYNGAVDLEKMGCNMLGINYKSGEPALSVNQIINLWSKRIKKGQILIYDNTKWVANVCSYTILENGLISGQISFVKNFNALSLNTRLIREKRMSLISNELTTKSEDNIVEYVYYDINPISIVSDDLSITASKVVNGVLGSFDYSKADKTIFRGVDIGVVTRDGVNVHPRTWYYAPLNKYSNGNGICYEISFNSPVIVGNRTRYITADDTWFGQNKWYTDYVKYADDDGFLDHITVGIFKREGASENSYTINDQNFPMITGDQFSIRSVIIEDYYPYKQPNEVFALNYQLTFLPVNETDVFLYPRFFEESLFLGEDYCNRKVYVITSDEKFSIFETKADTSLTLHEVTSITTNNYNQVTLTCDDDFTYKKNGGVAIVDSDYNILFAYNTFENGSDDHVNLFFGFKRKREVFEQGVYAIYIVFNDTQVDYVALTLNGVTTNITSSTSIRVEEGDTYSWTAVNKLGYHIDSGKSGSGTISSLVTVIEVLSRQSSYELEGTSDGGTVTWYAYAGSTTPITHAKYGDLIFYIITPDAAHVAPSPSSSYINLNNTNFTIDDDDETASVTLAPCSVKTFVFYIYSYGGTISGSYYNPFSDETIEISVANGGNQRVEIEYGGSYEFDFTPLPNAEASQTHYESDSVTSSVENIVCSSSVVTYSFSVSASNGDVSGYVEDYLGNRTTITITGGGGQTVTVEKAGSYSFDFTPIEHYYATTETSVSGSDIQSQPSDISFSATIKPKIVITAYNGTVSGSIYDADGNLTDTISVHNSSGIGYWIEPGGSYDIEFTWDDNTYYYTGTSSYSDTDVYSDASYTFVASAYPTYSLSVSASNGTASGTIYDRAGNVADTISVTNSGRSYSVIEGGSYSITFSYDTDNYYATTATSANNNDMQQDEAVNFSATAYTIYSLSISASYGTVSGYTYDRSGNRVYTISVTNTGQSFGVIAGGSYEFEFTLSDTTNYYFTGTTSYSVSDVNSNAGYTFTPLAYCWFNLSFPTGVKSITLTVENNSTTYKASDYPNGVSVKYVQGLSYSYSSVADEANGYAITSGGSGSGTTSANAVNISPTTQRVTIPAAYNIWSPSIDQDNSVAESTWKATFAVRNSYYSSTTFVINNHTVTIPQNMYSFTGLSVSSYGIVYNNVEWSTDVPTTNRISNATINLTNMSYTEIYNQSTPDYKYRVYFIRVKLRNYNSSSLSTNTTVVVDTTITLPSGFTLVDNENTWQKKGNNFEWSELYQNAAGTVKTKYSRISSEDIIYLTVIVKNW